MLTTNVGVTTTYFVGNYYEVTGGVVTKYYYAGSQRVAMRKNSVLSYLLSDHLGSASLVTDSSGTVINQTKYKAWGEVKYSSGSNPTNYTYTGQYSYTTDFGLMFYNARWYDPTLGRFAQADTIVPRGVQGLDRYAYVNNSPINYTDPSGHTPCTDDGYCGNVSNQAYQNEHSYEFYSEELEETYNWDVAEDFSLEELKTIYETAQTIQTYVNGLTGGKGLEWMLAYLGGTNIIHGNWSDGHGETLPGLFWGATISLGESWLNGTWDAMETLVHEFGHVLDINSGNVLGFGGGPADQMSYDLGGIPYFSLCRFCTGKSDPNNPPGQWTIHGGYGNESINDYFAEGFSASVLGLRKPSGVKDWIDGLITSQASLIH